MSRPQRQLSIQSFFTPSSSSSRTNASRPRHSRSRKRKRKRSEIPPAPASNSGLVSPPQPAAPVSLPPEYYCDDTLMRDSVTHEHEEESPGADDDESVVETPPHPARISSSDSDSFADSFLASTRFRPNLESASVSSQSSSALVSDFSPKTTRKRRRVLISHLLDPPASIPKSWEPYILPTSPLRVDASGFSPTHSLFDFRTCIIPDSVLCSLTPFEKQYWSIKQNFLGSFVFFKKGKFYELYENDGKRMRQLFGLKYVDGSRGGKANGKKGGKGGGMGGGHGSMGLAGVPESYGRVWMRKVLGRMERVVVVEEYKREENEDGERRGRRQKSGLERRVEVVHTPGTISEVELIPYDGFSNCLMGILECPATNEFGVVVVDCCKLICVVAGFVDTGQRAKLGTLLQQYLPTEILLWNSDDGGEYSGKTMKAISGMYPVVIEKRRKSEIQMFVPEEYDEILGQNAKHLLRLYADRPIVRKAMGFTFRYLKELKKDIDIIKSDSIHDYEGQVLSDHLILDGHTLENLELLRSMDDGSIRGTLYSLMQQSCTTFGGRELMREWIKYPLATSDAILERQGAVKDILSRPNIMRCFRKHLTGRNRLPRIERNLSFFFSYVNRKERARSHDASFMKRYTTKYLATIDGLRRMQTLVDELRHHLQDCDLGSDFVRNLVRGRNELFPEVHDILRQFELSDRDAAMMGKFVPKLGDDEDFDALIRKDQELTRTKNALLREYQRRFHSANVRYLPMRKTNTKKVDLVVGVPKTCRLPSGELFTTVRGTKNENRYTTQRLIDLAKQFEENDAEMEALQDTFMKKRFSALLAHRPRITRCVKTISMLDCLIAIAETSQRNGFCCPEVVVDSVGTSRLCLRGMWNPCLKPILNSAGKDFVPNDVFLGGRSSVVIVTGPNMAGKSTLLRSTCLAVILAQIGSFVPAQRMQFSVIDRIFTRIGANDKITTGESTFHVEMSETSNILRCATPRSLVILDELGRGTSTRDGHAIAYSVITDLAERRRPLTLFATHLFALTRELQSYPFVDFYRMDFAFEDSDGPIPRVIPTFQFVPGVCDKSFGVQVAMQAGIPMGVVERARTVSESRESRFARVVSGGFRGFGDAMSGMFGELGGNCDVDYDVAIRRQISVQQGFRVYQQPTEDEDGDEAMNEEVGDLQ